MVSTTPVILILGAGARIGQSVRDAFARRGYKVALTSRTATESDNTSDQISVAGDLSNPESVAGIFAKVKELLGIPSVVVYNEAGAATFGNAKDPLAIPLESYIRDMNVNTTSALVAAQQAALGFAQLPPSASRTFIFTGNCMNEKIVIAPLMDAGMGKSATSHMILTAATVYADQGFKFYYADERKPDGKPAYMDVNGEAHGEHYVQLAEGKLQGPWQQTFVSGIGYKDFVAT